MHGDRSRYGLLVSACGAILLALSVFLPWYGVTVTPSGIAAVEQAGSQFAAQFGDSALQSQVSAQDADLNALAGRQVTALSAHQALRDLNVVLLVLAGLALVDVLFPLARTVSTVPEGAGGSVILVGAVAAACVVFRMLVPPTPEGGLIALSLREGAWLALLGALAIIAGGLWPRHRPADALESSSDAAWSSLSGWSPGA
jgi:hypothetical protein